ncbi:MAG: DUF620 domain-containing protein [Candidatus Aminicenantaceae bacterium]
MKRIFSLCFLSLFLLSLVVTPGLSQEASDVLAKMIDAGGGRKNLEKAKDMTMTGNIELVSMGMSGSLTVYSKEPNKMRMDIEIMGMVITQAYDGETAWGINPQTGASEELSGEQADDLKRQAMGNDSLLNPAKYGITYTLKGKETVDGAECFILERTHSDGYTVSLYINSETYLPYKTKATTMGQMGVEVEAESFPTDYKKVGGMMIPHSLRVLQDGEEFMTMTFTEVTVNTGIEDTMFKME